MAAPRQAADGALIAIEQSRDRILRLALIERLLMARQLRRPPGADSRFTRVRLRLNWTALTTSAYLFCETSGSPTDHKRLIDPIPGCIRKLLDTLPESHDDLRRPRL
jgi:hypothetical protein